VDYPIAIRGGNIERALAQKTLIEALAGDDNEALAWVLSACMWRIENSELRIVGQYVRDILEDQ